MVLLAVCGLLLASTPASAASTSDPVGVYADGDGTLTVIYGNETTESLGVTGEVVGPMKDLDNDSRLEAPFVDSSSDLRIIDVTGERSTLVADDLKTGKKYVATGDWDDDGLPEVFYENSSDGKLYQVEYNSAPSPVTGPDGNPLATNSPVGVADYDNDGTEDLLFLGSSSTLKYYDGQQVESTGFSSFGSNNGLGIGAPADFDGDGTPRVPYVTGSKNLALLSHDGSKKKLNTSYQHAAKAPVAAANWTGDSTLEILHVNTDNYNIYYSRLNGSVDPVYADGAKLSATVGPGVAPAATPPAPDISDYAVSNPEGRDLRVAFDSSERLVDIAVNVTGPEDAALNESAFSESGSGPYHYEATWTAPEDGNYTATLTVAEDADGADGASGQNGTVSIQTPGPTVTNVTLAEVNSSDGLVAGGHTLRVTANVTNESALTSVVANASAFGAGDISLSAENGTYVGTFAVDGSAVSEDGEQSVRVVATNEYDHTGTNESGTLFVDTTPPTADAGPDRTVEEDTRVSFDGDGSTDNSDIVRYVWSFGDGETTTGRSVVHSYPDPGTYEVTLTVHDAVGHTAMDTATVDVENVSTSSSDASDTEVRTVTETEVVTRTETVYVDRSTNVTVVSRTSDSVRTVVRDPTAGEQVTMRFPTRAGDTFVSRIELTTTVEHSFGVTVRADEGAPAGVPALGEARAAEPVGYVLVNHSVADANVSDVTMTVVVPKSAYGGGGDVVLYRYDDGWNAHEMLRMNETDRTIRYLVEVPGLSAFAVGVQRPDFQLADVRIVREGSVAYVRGTIENTGAAAGTLEVPLRIDDDTVATRMVTVPAGGSERVTFRHAFESAGTYRLAIGDVTAGTFSVEAATAAPAGTSASATPSTAPTSDSGGPPVWIAVAGVAGLVVGAVVSRQV